MISEKLVISPRFCGPPNSGNGGYVCGRLASHVQGPVAVRLKAPPPLEAELQIEGSPEAGLRLTHGSRVIAEARAADVDLTPPRAPSLSDAEKASESYIGFTHHAFPRCFVCGPQRLDGDGLRIFPGWVDSGSMVAAPWIPQASLAKPSHEVPSEFIWAALDCTSGFAVLPVPEGKAIVLGELCARLNDRVAPDQSCVVVGWKIQIDGRKRIAGSAIFSDARRLVAIARATWIEVPASAFGGR